MPSKQELQARLDAVYHRNPRILTEHQKKNIDQKRLMALADVEDNELWKVVLQLLDEHAQTELHCALGPGKSDGDRQYNAGRAACAEDLACIFRDLQFKAQTQARGRG